MTMVEILPGAAVMCFCLLGRSTVMYPCMVFDSSRNSKPRPSGITFGEFVKHVYTELEKRGHPKEAVDAMEFMVDLPYGAARQGEYNIFVSECFDGPDRLSIME